MKKGKETNLFRLMVMTVLAMMSLGVSAQTYKLRREHDSLYFLNEWRLPYPVYQFQTGDVDGDGQEDAMVGVIKSTRFYPEQGRRLFIFKQVKGKVRPLWLGSKLGGILVDFQFVDGKIRALEMTTDSLYVTSDYRWAGFGMAFERFVEKGMEQERKLKYLKP